MCFISGTDGETTIAVPHYDDLTHPVTLDYMETHRDTVATLSWSLTVRMRRLEYALQSHGNSVTSHDGEKEFRDGETPLWRPVAVVRGEVFAVRRTFLSSIGGLYDNRLEYGSAVAEHVELSLRTWMCGGHIKVTTLCIAKALLFVPLLPPDVCLSHECE